VKLINRFLAYLNRRQQESELTAFTIAVIKKYNEDGAGRQAALLAYYGFLSLFPFLLVLTTVTDTFLSRSAHLYVTVIGGITNYFPLLGTQLSSHVGSIHAGSILFYVSLLFTIYGTRGVADAFRRGVEKIWLIPKKERVVFPESLFKNACLIIVGGLGFLIASVTAALASSAGHGVTFRLLSLAINLIILFTLFSFLINFTLPNHIPLKEIRSSAAFATIALVILQLLGGYIIGRELKKLDELYSYFALTLGLIFWIYLQTQVLFYSIEIAVVSSKKLWPRSLDSAHPSKADDKLSLEIN
jgi:membrane protein